MAAKAVLPELARDSQLDTDVSNGYCVHSFSETPRVTRKEVWERTTRIGAGGFGTVWLESCIDGHKNGNNLFRAVKVLQLPSDVPAASAGEAVAKYGRELEALAKFSQAKYVRCFVQSYGWYQDSSSISICLEYLPYGDLQVFLANQADPRLREPEAQQIISQVLDGLAFMHGEDFAHGDLKPANILIKSHGPNNWWVKLSDFGLSKRNEAITGTTTIRGTPGFMPPELLGYLASDFALTGAKLCAADLWNLGEIAFQLATGKPVFTHQGMLTKYTIGNLEFPVSELQHVMASPAMVQFIASTMLVDYQKRPTAAAASAHQWIQEAKTISTTVPRPVLPCPLSPASHTKFASEKRDSTSIGDSSGSEPNVSSVIDYRPWSTASRAAPDSALAKAGMRTTLGASMGPSNVMHDVSGTYTSKSTFTYSADEFNASQPCNTKALSTDAMDEIISLSGTGMAKLFFPITEFQGKQGGSDRIIFSLDCTKFATTSSQVGLSLWSVKEKALFGTIGGACSCATFSHDSRQIAAVKHTGNVYIDNAYVVEANLNRLFEVPREILIGTTENAQCVTFSQRGDQVAAGTKKGDIIIWDVSRRRSPQKIRAYSAPVIWVAYLPAENTNLSNGNDIICLGTDGSIGLWTHNARSIFPGRWSRVSRAWWGPRTRIDVPGDVSAVVVSRAFVRLAVATSNGFIGVWYGGRTRNWDHGLKRESGIKGHEESINALDLSPDSRLLLSASKGCVWIWKIPGLLPVTMIRPPAGLNFRSIVFCPDSNSLISTSSDDVVRLWDAGRILSLNDIQTHLDHATFVAVSPDQRYTASVSRNLHNIPLREGSSSIPLTQQAYDNEINTLMVWDVVQARPLTLLGGHRGDALSVSFSTDSKHVGSVSADHLLHIWDVGTGLCLDTIAPLTDLKDRIPGAALSPGLRYCASVFCRYHDDPIGQHKADNYKKSRGFAISLYDIRLNTRQSKDSHLWKTLRGTNVADAILSMTFSSDSTKLVAVDQRDNVTIWDTATGCMNIRLPDPTTPPLASGYGTHTYEVDSPALRFIESKSELIAFSGLHSARVWNIESGAQTLRHIGSRRVFTKPRKQECVAGNISPTNGRSMGVFPYYSRNTPLAASPDGRRCVMLRLAADNLALWDMVTGEIIRELTDNASKRDIFQAAFSPDSRWLVTASSQDIVVNDAATGLEHTRIQHGLGVPLRTVAFWPDSRYIMSGCYKRMLQFWDVHSGAMVKDFEGHTGRPSFIL